MRLIKNDIMSFSCTDSCADSVLAAIENLCLIIKEYPDVISPFSGKNKEIEGIFRIRGFRLYSTIRKTMVFYDSASDSFFKIIHPISVRQKILFRIMNKAKSLYKLSKTLISKGLKVPEIIAYGRIKGGGQHFIVMKRLTGESLHDILIEQKKIIPKKVYFETIDEIIKIHQNRYWLRDTHLGHFFVNDMKHYGFLEIDSIKREPFPKLRNKARDLPGLAHPGLTLSDEEKMTILNHYMDEMDIRNRDDFVQMVKYYILRKSRDKKPKYNSVYGGIIEKLEVYADEILKNKERVLIAVAGAAGAGKSHFGKYIRKNGLGKFDKKCVAVIDDSVMWHNSLCFFHRRIKIPWHGVDELKPFFKKMPGYKKIVFYMQANPSLRISEADILLKLSADENVRRFRLMKRYNDKPHKLDKFLNMKEIDDYKIKYLYMLEIKF